MIIVGLLNDPVRLWGRMGSGDGQWWWTVVVGSGGGQWWWAVVVGSGGGQWW